MALLKRICLMVLLLAAGSVPVFSRPPNFVVIFCDDMGYADIGPFGAKGYKTPNLDRMAREGMKFTSFCVARSVCRPTRTTPAGPHRRQQPHRHRYHEC